MYNEDRLKNRIPKIPLNFGKILNFFIKIHVNELVIINSSMVVQNVAEP
jgi:hypothetical protein